MIGKRSRFCTVCLSEKVFKGKGTKTCLHETTSNDFA